MSWLIARILRLAWRKGIVAGNKAWVVAGGLALVALISRRALKREPNIVFSEELPAGAQLLIHHEAAS